MCKLLTVESEAGADNDGVHLDGDNHSFIYPSIHALIYSHWFIHPFIHPFIHSLCANKLVMLISISCKLVMHDMIKQLAVETALFLLLLSWPW
jgi:hypothetical protein